MTLKKRCALPLERKDGMMLNLKRVGLMMALPLMNLLVIGCAVKPTETRVEKQIAASRPEFCTNALPIYVTEADTKVISDKAARQILAHNKLGRKLCGW